MAKAHGSWLMAHRSSRSNYQLSERPGRAAAPRRVGVLYYPCLPIRPHDVLPHINSHCTLYYFRHTYIPSTPDRREKKIKSGLLTVCKVTTLPQKVTTRTLDDGRVKNVVNSEQPFC
jgi:hypothetical protein